ncbi:MAG TPA: ParB/RepB/Spo0J family partition protein [Bacteroidales bacterium]|nr:ParB/RepB/Spo0J family partition protein [Bacteroidales bacterium]
MQSKKKALGRGLNAILESPETDITSRDISGNYVVGAIAHLNVDTIESNPFQPRTHFDESELAELTLSIQTQGIIQPLTVRKMGYDKYQLIAGERRLKAARLAGMTEVPAYIRVANDEQMLEMALVENIHRENLNPLEIAISFQRLIEECEMNQEDLSRKVGKDRSTVSNYIRLLKLPTEIQIAIRDKRITMGHARALINIPDRNTQLVFLHRILEKKLSVRQVEDLVRSLSEPEPAVITPHEPAMLPVKFEKARESLHHRLNADVAMKVYSKGNGNIIIPFTSEEDFDRIVSHLQGQEPTP